MNVGHEPQCANWHSGSQVPIDTLKPVPFGTLLPGMAHDFRNALMWHLNEHNTTIADLVSKTGVSRDVINKLKAREDASTTVENAMLIAAYYGKTVNQFIMMQSVSDRERVQNLFDLLQPEEARLLEAQIQGVLSKRTQRSA